MISSPSTWIVGALRGAERLARQDEADNARLARQLRASQPDREPVACSKCGKPRGRLSTLPWCEICREKESRAKRDAAKAAETAEAKEARLAKRRAEEKARRDRLMAAGDKRESERLAAWRLSKRVERAQAELKARGYEVAP